MKNALIRFICGVLIVCMGAFPFAAHAGMVGTGEALAAAQSQGAHERVLDFLSRDDVRRLLESRGVNAEAARDRVRSMTDAEVAGVAGRIDQLPAGGVSGWAALATLSILWLIWHYWVK